jgi:CelD/BcsL family acetyltransferase involved in cellulose biosynthesis
MNFHSKMESDFTVSVGDALPASWPRAGETGPGRSSLIFQSREFVEAWRASFGRNGRFKPQFVTVERAGNPVMLLPLVIERRRGLKVLTFIDQGQADYNAPILFDVLGELTAEQMRGLWAQVLAHLPRVDVVRLDKLPGRVGARANPMVLLASGREAESSHGNRLDRSWEEVENALFSPKELKKKERALARQASVELLIADDPQTRSAVLDALIAQKQRRFEETFVPGFDANTDALAFLRAATEVFAGSGNLHLSALVVGGDIAAVQWGLMHGRTYYALVTGFAAGKWAGFSCSRLLTRRLLLWLHERGFTYFDQGFGDEPYKLQSADTDTPLHRLVAPVTVRGGIALATERLASRLRASRIWERLRPLKWVVLRALRRPRGVSGPGA